MKFISTRQQTPAISFREALMHGLAPDGGLYIPEHIPKLAAKPLPNASLPDLGLTILSEFLPEIPRADLSSIIHNALNFPIPLVPLQNNIYLLEVFHGPTLAFKDVGARFMANALSYFLKKEKESLSILVATSGDTGSAIANAFHNMPNINVFVLYPSEKITLLQEKQMTTLGGNIHAIEVEGTFDDCQRLVKAALMDADVKNGGLRTTANSINISRLLPQIIYHSWGICQLQKTDSTKPILSIPSGNLGNLTAAIYAERMGFPIQSFIAATNINNILPLYLQTGEFIPTPSKHSFANAMDVGNPSNFERLLALYGKDLHAMQAQIKGISISDEGILKEIRETYDSTGYILDPHTAVGVAAAKEMKTDNSVPIIVTATAHPAKFPEVVKQAIGIDVELPESLQLALSRPKQAKKMPPDLEALKKILHSSGT